MKVITLVPVKNEGWILSKSLENYSTFSDHIIVADQDSTDETLLICKKFNKVSVIENPYKSHTNQIRWLLLDEARKIPGNNLILYLDADELISPSCINEMKEISKEQKNIVAFKAEWIQLLHSFETYRIDGVWKENYKEFAFLDDRKIDYNRKLITNDHSNRIPDIAQKYTLITPILHLQYLAKKRCEIKQAFYMCTERTQGISPERINHRYSVARFSQETKVAKTQKEWLFHINLPDLSVFEEEDLPRKSQVLELFKQYGLDFFEPLEIWHIKDLKDVFLSEKKHQPITRNYPKSVIFANSLKNKIKNVILMKLKK